MKWILPLCSLLCFVVYTHQAYDIFTFPTEGLSYNEWKDLAYLQTNGISCGHAATWKDEKGWWDILNLIIDEYGGFIVPDKRNPKYENVEFESLTPLEREEFYEHFLTSFLHRSEEHKRDSRVDPFFFSTFIGAVKEPSSTTFYWNVGSLRGQPFFSIDNNVVGTGYIPFRYFINTGGEGGGDQGGLGKRNISPDNNDRLIPLTPKLLSKKRLPTNYLSYEDWDVQFESGFNCLQEYCFPRSFIHYFAYTEFSRGLFFSMQTGYGPNTQENFIFGEMDSIGVDINLYPDFYYFFIDYGFVGSTQSIIEFESVPTIANYHGGSKYQVSSGQYAWIEGNEYVNSEGLYLGRISSPEQYQWILDELQCKTFDLWLGYKVDELTQDVLKGPGPGEGKPVYTEEYGYIPGEFHAKRTMPGIAPTEALSLNVASGVGTWSRKPTSTSQLLLIQAEPCSFNAGQFFGINFQSEQRKEKMCYPNPSTDWSADITQVYDGVIGYTQGTAFYAGQSVTFTNPFNEKSATMYFDCQCRTNPIINLACLGSENWPGCQLYTNAQEYYDSGDYEQRLANPGLAESYRRMEAYYYWIYLLHAVN